MQKIQIHLKSFHSKLLNNALAFIEKNLLSTHSKLYTHTQKSYKRKYTVIRSPHVHKKSREQFQLTEYHWIFCIQSSQPAMAWLSVLKTGAFYGVQMKTTVKADTFLSGKFYN